MRQRIQDLLEKKSTIGPMEENKGCSDLQDLDTEMVGEYMKFQREPKFLSTHAAIDSGSEANQSSQILNAFKG